MWQWVNYSSYSLFTALEIWYQLFSWTSLNKINTLNCIIMCAACPQVCWCDPLPWLSTLCTLIPCHECVRISQCLEINFLLSNPYTTHLFLSRNFCRLSPGSSPPLDEDALLDGAMRTGLGPRASGTVLLTSGTETWWRPQLLVSWFIWRYYTKCIYYVRR